MSMILVLKLVLVPALMAGVTLAGRRWGPATAGWLSAFPVVSGPILLIMALEQGPAFTTTAAVGTLSAVLAILTFGVAYARAAIRHAWPASLAIGFGAYALAVTALHQRTPLLAYMAPLVLLALLLVPRLYPGTVDAPPPPPSRPAQDLLLRMLAGAALTLLVTQFAAHMGPGLSGMFAMFPVMASVLAVFTHRHDGPGAAIKLLKGSVLGYYAFGTFCTVLALTLPTESVAFSFLAALCAALTIQVLSRLALQSRQPRPAIWSSPR